jgi:ferredoxin
VEGSRPKGHDQLASSTEASGVTRVNIDLSRCEGHGRCVTEAPEVFGYDDVTNQSFVLKEAVLDDHRPKIMRAIEDCPERAITLVEDVSSNESSEGKCGRT